MSTSLVTPLRGPVSLRVPFAVTSAAEVRHALEGWLEANGCSEGTVEDARLIVSELVGNSVRHASPLGKDSMLVRWRIDEDRLLLSVCDGGGSTTPSRVVAGPDAVGGRGLAIVEALSAAWWVERTERMHAVHVRLTLG